MGDRKSRELATEHMYMKEHISDVLAVCGTGAGGQRMPGQKGKLAVG